MQSRYRQSAPGAHALDSATLHARLGMDRSNPDVPASKGADASRSILDSDPGAHAAEGIATASARAGDVWTRDGTARGEHHRIALGSGGHRTQARVDSSGPGEGQEGDRGAVERHGDGCARPLRRRALGVCVRVPGKAIKQVCTKAWHRARKRAGITDFRFHDLRHTWASWHVQHGTPLFALQELGGWETERMVRRYAHLSADHLAVYVGNSQIHGTFLAQPARSAETAR